MKIAVWHNMPFCGGFRQVYYHVKGLAARGHCIHVWHPDMPTCARLSDLVEESMVPLHIHGRPWPNGKFRQALWVWQNTRMHIEALREHVADWSMAFANLKTLLAPGGRVLITCPHFYQLHEVPHDYWRPTLFALRHHAEQGRLKIVHEEAAGDAWDVLGTALGNCQVAKAGSRFLQRPFVPVGRWLVAAAFGLLKRRIPQRLFALHSPLYLSNIVVLEKPGSSGNMGGNGE